MYYNKDEVTEKVVLFYVICAIIFVLNLTGVIYGIHQDKQLSETNTAIQTLKQEKETGNILEDTAIACEYGAKQMWAALKVFVVKILFGVIISTLLIVPNMIYKFAEKEVLTCMIPDDIAESIVLFIVLVMTLYNMISPFFEIGDYVSVLKEAENVLSDFKIDQLINSFSIINY